MNNLKKDIEYFIKETAYIVPVILTVLLSFGFVLTHSSVNVDTLSGARYFREGEMLAQGRPGMVLFEMIFNVMEFNPWFVDLVAVILLIMSAITFCMAFRKITNDKINMVAYTIFSCLFLSYPLICEIFVYTPASITIGLGYFGIAVSLNFIHKYLKDNDKKYFIFTTLILAFVVSSYESFAVVYLCAILVLFILDCIYNEKDLKFVDTLKEGIKLILPLAISIVAIKIISTIIMLILNIEPSKNAAKQIAYFTEGFIPAIKHLISSAGSYYVIRGLIYFPITVLVLAMFVNFGMNIYYYVKKKNITLFLLFIGTILALFALSIIQGQGTPYRTCQVFAFFVAFTFMTFTQMILSCNKYKAVNIIVIILMFMLVFYQAKDTHNWFYINYLRYEQEKVDIIKIAEEIKSKDFNPDKPIVFIGKYRLSDYVMYKTYVSLESFRYKLASKIVNIFDKGNTFDSRITHSVAVSYIDWALVAFNDGNIELFKWLERLGYRFKKGTQEMYEEATIIVNKLPAYPDEGHILETKDYIIVKLHD